MNNLRAILPRPLLPPLWRETRFVGEVLEAVRRPPIPSHNVSVQPRQVLLVPGFLAGDSSLRLLSRFLARSGYEPLSSGIARNVDCSEASVRRLEQIVEDEAQAGSRVAIVGHSRGGLFARALAVRRPDLVAGIVMLGSPHRDQLAVHPVLWAEIAALAVIGASGAAHVLTLQCAAGPCCESFREELTTPLPDAVSAVSVYSRNDGVVDWRSCIDENAANVEVNVTHIGMIAREAVFRVVAEALAAFSFTPPSQLRTDIVRTRQSPDWTEEAQANAA